MFVETMHHCLRALFAVGLWLVSFPCASDDRNKSPVLHVPDGFVIERVDEGNTRFPMFAAFDDRGRLFVAESSGLDLYAELTALTRKCRVRMLEDRDGDGKFETAKVFADKLVFPMGLAWRDGKLYVADPPELVTYEDSDADGVADKRTVILTGFGHKDNGSLHGLIFGPDGWLYMTMGSPDGYNLKRADGTLLTGTSGALIRCRPPRGRVSPRRDRESRRDSPTWTNPEVVSRGFVNLVEVAFTPRGDCIGTDNWYQHPQDGYRDALVHLVDGGLYPFEADTGTRFVVTGDPLPPVARFPAVALSGICTYRGNVFPEQMQGSFFTAQHNSRMIGRHVLVAAGSSFRAEHFDFLTSDDPDFHPSDVLESADGSLLVVDTGAWYVQHCPTGRIRQADSTGGIYRVRRKDAFVPKDPWGAAIDWNGASADRLIERLCDSRPAVRDRAVERLAAIGQPAIGPLSAALNSDSPLLARQGAIWALASIADSAAMVPLRSTLVSDDPEIIVPAARVLAMRGDAASSAALTELLTHRSPAVRLAAAEALARCGSGESLPALWKALKAEPDRMLEHALVHAVHHLASAAELESALADAHPRIQRAALRLLDQPPRPAGALKAAQVVLRVQSSDAELRRTATEILARHPEWADQAVNLIRGWLATEQPSEEERRGLRSVVLAFQQERAVQELVGAAIVNRDGKTTLAQRAFTLEVIAETILPKLPASWTVALSHALRDANDDVRLQALRTAAVLQLSELDGELVKLAESESQPAEVRRQALQAVVRRRPALSPALFQFLAADLRDAEHPLVRLAAAELLGQCRLAEDQLREVIAIAQIDPLISPAVLMPTIRRSTTEASAPLVLGYLANSMRAGWRPSEAELDEVLKAISPNDRDKAASLRELHETSIAGQRARLESFEPLLAEGNAERGRQVFFGKRATCSVCHRIAGEGGQVGPDLTKAGAIRSGRDLLESMILPSATIAQGYDPFLVTTKDGRTTTGVITRQTSDVLFLRDSSGAEVRFRKELVEDFARTGSSIMPEGLERALSEGELRDLLAFLQVLK
ncbi:MAG: PVC-type heme-binding CxxCH protein [Pirellulales bacterium]